MENIGIVLKKGYNKLGCITTGPARLGARCVGRNRGSKPPPVLQCQLSHLRGKSSCCLHVGAKSITVKNPNSEYTTNHSAGIDRHSSPLARSFLIKLFRRSIDEIIPSDEDATQPELVLPIWEHDIVSLGALVNAPRRTPGCPDQLSNLLLNRANIFLLG